MSTHSRLSTPTAILIGSVIISAGLYFGLRDRRADSPPPPVAAPPPVPVPMGPTSASPPPVAPPPVAVPAMPGAGLGGLAPAQRPAIVARAKADAAAALEAKKPELVKACWDPIVKKTPGLGRSKYLYNFSFDAEGREVARGISEVREESRPDVAECLRAQPMGLRIAPLGSLAVVDEVALNFP